MYNLLLLINIINTNKTIRFLVITCIIVLFFSVIYWYLGNNINFTISNVNNVNSHNVNSQQEYTLTFIDALYFSIGTQTAVGYGDITARSQLLRGITIIQITLLIIQLATFNL